MTTCGVSQLWQADVADIKVAILALLEQEADQPLTITSSRPISSGVITAGAKSIGVANIGAGTAYFNGQPLEAGYGINYEFAEGFTYPEVAYDATGTTLLIEVVRVA